MADSELFVGFGTPVQEERAIAVCDVRAGVQSDGRMDSWTSHCWSKFSILGGFFMAHGSAGAVRRAAERGQEEVRQRSIFQASWTTRCMPPPAEKNWRQGMGQVKEWPCTRRGNKAKLPAAR